MAGVDYRKSEKGMTLLEALVSTAIIGIGFVAIFQMVQYSVRSIDVSGERTKATFLTGMVAEDLISEKFSNSPTTDVKMMDYLISIKTVQNLHGEWVHAQQVLQALELITMLPKINLKNGMIVFQPDD